MPDNVVPIGIKSTIRALRSVMLDRLSWMAPAGLTHEGARDVFQSLGYKKTLEISDYWARYLRNEVAARVIEAFPKGTWRGVGEVIENEDPNVLTDFELAANDLIKRLDVWPMLMRTDILSGIGRFGVLVIGAPGRWESQMPKLGIDDVGYLFPYSEVDVRVIGVEENVKSPRYGHPTLYKIKRQVDSQLKGATLTFEKDVHWSRVIHASEGLLDNCIYAPPRLQRVWNRIDDLEKVVGSGSEAFWLRAHQGYQFDLDKELELNAEAEDDLAEEVDEFVHGMRRAMRTRGVKVTTLGSDVANFDRNVESILGLIAAGTGIPQRILSGSERGQLASQQDRVNWTERVKDRRTEYAGPYLLRPLLNRLIEYGALPEPESYDIRWPDVFDLSDDERAIIGGRWAEVNQKNKSVVLTTDEMRDRVFGLSPLTAKQIAREKELRLIGAPAPPSTRTEPPVVTPPNPEDQNE